MEREKLIGLVTKAQEGDSAAAEELFSAFYEDVYYFALKTVKDADIACDITQEAFLEIIGSINKLEEPAAFVTWMKQITYHQCTRYFKKKKDVLVEEDEEGNTIFDTLADESEGSIPSEVYEKEEFRKTIMDMVDSLSEQQRAAVMLYYFDELPVAQIAQIQGVSENTVKSRLNYARGALKKSVEDYEKKNGIKLHSFALLPLLLLYFRKESMPKAMAFAVRKAVFGTAKGGLLAWLLGLPLAIKIGAGVVAVALLIGGFCLPGAPEQGGAIPTTPAAETAAEQTTATTASTHTEHVFAEGSCACTICGEMVHEEGNVHPFCGKCSERMPFVDADGDGKCETCGTYSCSNIHAAASHGDANGDDKCDICGEYMCKLWMADHVFDYSDGVYDMRCDRCGSMNSGAVGGGDENADKHGDANGDNRCDCCGEWVCKIRALATYGGSDANGDNKCDICSYYMCDGHFEGNPHYDMDGNSECDICKHGLCAHQMGDHKDENGDSHCDWCYSTVE